MNATVLHERLNQATIGDGLPSRRGQALLGPGRAARGGGGFTLIELLVVIAIIAILASLLLAGAYMAQQAAKTDRTKALLAKLNTGLIARYKLYASRPIPSDIDSLISRHNALSPKPAGRTLVNTSPKDVAYARLFAIREMMRMEMPDQWIDVSTAAQILPANYRTSINDWLQSVQVANTHANKDQYASAECLYLIMTTSVPGADSSRGSYSEFEIGDKDGDGLLEFQDTWGNPIGFIRWPVGFTGESELMKTTERDPFDTHGNETSSFALYPLIYSYGPDGLPGLWTTNSTASERYGAALVSPFASLTVQSSGRAIGQPMATASNYTSFSSDTQKSVKAYFDNLHNHLLNIRGQ